MGDATTSVTPPAGTETDPVDDAAIEDAAADDASAEEIAVFEGTPEPEAGDEPSVDELADEVDDIADETAGDEDTAGATA
ncbi:MAG: DUF4397 domain-containing protein, partial [Acidimicrobiales bacterium]